MKESEEPKAQIEITKDGPYLVLRNQLTLRRCGRSANKPFCDGSHAALPGLEFDLPEIS